jgi:hypothetical protein
LVIGWEEGTGAGLEVLFMELFWEFCLALVFDASAERPDATLVFIVMIR